MQLPFLSNESAPKQLLITGLVIIACWIAFQIFSYLTGIFIFAIKIDEIVTIAEDLKNPKAIAFLKYIQAVTSFGMFTVAAFIISKAISKDWLSFLRLDKNPGLIPMLIAAVFIIVILPFTNLLTSLNNQIHFPETLKNLENFFRSKENQMEMIMESFLNIRGFGGLLINLIIIAVIPAIGEELVFRGIIQDRFTLWFKNHHWAIFLTAFIFSALHIQFLSFLPRLLLGIVFGYIFIWSKSIWITIQAHFLNNAMAVIYYHLYFNGKADKNLELIGTADNGLMYSISGALIGTGLLYLIYKYYKKKVIN